VSNTTGVGVRNRRGGISAHVETIQKESIGPLPREFLQAAIGAALAQRCRPPGSAAWRHVELRHVRCDDHAVIPVKTTRPVVYAKAGATVTIAPVVSPRFISVRASITF
jgi:hypothetical protein